MPRVFKSLLTLMAAWLLLTGPSHAISMLDFGKLNDDDEAGYLAYLIDGTAKMLKTGGHPDQAAKVLAFFNDASSSGGLHQFAAHLKVLRSINSRNSTNPNNRAHEYIIEDAMEMTLKDIGVHVPAKKLVAVGQDFQPDGPPRGQQTFKP